jgi:hypothetical protein
MIVAGDTEFPYTVREYADDNGVEIVWTRWLG